MADPSYGPTNIARDSIQGMTIPKKGKDITKFLEDIEELIKDGNESITDEEKVWAEYLRKEKTLQDTQKKLDNLQLKYNSPAIYKMKSKMTKTYDKYLANGQWFKSSLKAFIGLGKKAGSLLMDILKFIFLMAIFDPKGKFLKSILHFILGMVKWFAKILGEYLPAIIATMVDLIFNVLPPILKDIVSSLSDIIYDMFTEMMKKMPDGPMKSVMGFIQSGFGKDGIVTKFFTMLADWFPQILILLGALKVMSVIMPILNAAWALGEILVGALASIMGVYNTVMMIAEATGMGFAASLWALIVPMLVAAAPILLVVLAIVALIAIFVLLWKYAEKISDFFDGLIDRFKNMSSWMKGLIKVLAMVFLPITIFIASIYAIAKLFKSFKKIGVGNTFKAIGAGVMNLAKGAKDFISSGINNAWDSVKNSGVGKAVGGAINSVINIGKDLWDGLMNSSFGKWLSATLDRLILQFHSFMQHPLGGGDANKTAFVSYYEMQYKMDQKDAEKLYEKMASTVIAGTNQTALQKWIQDVRESTKVGGIEGNETVVKAIDALIEVAKKPPQISKSLNVSEYRLKQ